MCQAELKQLYLTLEALDDVDYPISLTDWIGNMRSACDDTDIVNESNIFGPRPLSYVKAMLTGYGDISETKFGFTITEKGRASLAYLDEAVRI